MIKGSNECGAMQMKWLLIKTPTRYKQVAVPYSSLAIPAATWIETL